MKELLSAIWPVDQRVGALTLFTLPGADAFHTPLSELDRIDENDVAFLRNLKQNIYFGTASRVLGLGNKQPGKDSDILVIPVFSLDLDFFNPKYPKAHAATNLPRDLDEAAPIFSHLPDPSAIVLSGNGAQLHWFLSEPLRITSPADRNRAKRLYRAFQAPCIAKAKELGWQLDSTSSLRGVWRLPGFVNQKTDRDATMPYCDAKARYSIAALGLTAEQTEAEIETPESTELVWEDVIGGLKRVDPKNRWKANIDRLLACESFAEPGERDNVLQGICSTIAWHPAGRSADPQALAEIFRPAFELWAAEDDAKNTVEEELKKAADKIRRSQEDYLAKQEERASELAGLARVLGLSEEQEHDPDFVLRHALINYGNQYYAFDFDRGQYSHLLRESQVLTKVRDAWASAPAGISLTFRDSKGKTVHKELKQIKREYCTVAYPLVGDMELEESYFDVESGAFHLAHAVIRPTIKPVFNPWIDEWLTVFAGDHTRPNETKPVCDWLKDWLAILPLLGRANVGLYLEGEKGTGKTLLAQGAARLWRDGGPANLDLAVGEFNEEILQTPLLQLEEGTTAKSKHAVSIKVRAFLGQSSFTINPKGLTPYSLKGNIRILICANNPNVLDFGTESLSISDLNAICDRIYHLCVRDESARWLEKNPRHREWSESGQFAAHCLWLSQNREVERFGRFWQPGNRTSLHASMVMGNEDDNCVYEWITRFASDPRKLYETYRGRTDTPTPRALIGDGYIFINAQGMLDCWSLYMPNTKPLSSKVIGSALVKMRDKLKRRGFGHDRTSFHALRPDMILEWAMQRQIGSPERIKAFSQIVLDFSKLTITDLIQMIGDEDRNRLKVMGGGLDGVDED